MFRWKRTPWLSIVALGAVLALAGGCGGDDDDGGNGAEVLVRDGTWSLTTTSTGSGPGEECIGTFGPITIDYPLCEFSDPGDLTGDEGECEVEAEGDETHFHCDDMVTEEGCTFTTHNSGMGTFDETSFTMTLTSYVTVSPASPACLAMAAADPCTTTYSISGIWVNATGCTTGRGIPVRALFRAAGRLAGSH